MQDWNADLNLSLRMLRGTLDLPCVKSTTTYQFTFRIINLMMGSWGLRLTWLDCKDSKRRLSAPHSLGSSFQSLMLILSNVIKLNFSC